MVAHADWAPNANIRPPKGPNPAQRCGAWFGPLACSRTLNLLRYPPLATPATAQTTTPLSWVTLTYTDPRATHQAASSSHTNTQPGSSPL
ncbi:hypothetical protein V494_04072 [Pseudogymnoascus sp. VKM F-4513 (FW-928)]|nr:hypothetical protein V494_04072 [Pseudogymnoascus sp. VKM F-4513 (FW-928)]